MPDRACSRRHDPRRRLTAFGGLAPPGHVVIPDRPGCGLSYRIDHRSVDYRSAAADWVLDLVESIEAEHIDLLGNSMGGYFAMAFAIAHPETVRRLVLLGAPTGLYRGGIPLFLRLLGNPIIGPLVGRIRITDPEAWRRQVFGGLSPPGGGAARNAHHCGRRRRHPGSRPCRAQHVAESAEHVQGSPRHHVARQYGAPAGTDAVRVGDRDAYSPPSSGQSLARQMPQARLEIIADAGHMPQLERPNAVADAITAHLSSAGP
jgi:pimeloyl-ACP methyl ester carboxylesterase